MNLFNARRRISEIDKINEEEKKTISCIPKSHQNYVFKNGFTKWHPNVCMLHIHQAFTIHTLIQLTHRFLYYYECVLWKKNERTKSWNHQINLFKSLLNRIFMAHFRFEAFYFFHIVVAFLFYFAFEIRLYCVYFIVISLSIIV